MSGFEFPSNIMLGKQAEKCFEFFLKQSEHYQLLASNIQIQGSIETLGELDYLVYDLRKKLFFHIELACKFYLFDSDLSGSKIHKWIGPNRKDTLIDKLQKLKEHQFPLFFRKETQSLLKTLKLEIPSVEQRCCLKAFLFLPKGFNLKTLPVHYLDCVVGYYIHFSEISSEENEKATYAIPAKRQWLVPPQTIISWHPFSEVKQLISDQIKNKRSPLVYKKVNESIEKFFVIWWDKELRR